MRKNLEEKKVKKEEIFDKGTKRKVRKERFEELEKKDKVSILKYLSQYSDPLL